MNEAPFSYTIKVKDASGFDEMFTIRETDSREYFSKITALKKWLLANGYTTTSNQQHISQAPAPTPGGNIPVCPYHGTMKASNYGGFYCSKKLQDGTYCQSTSDGPAPAAQYTS